MDKNGKTVIRHMLPRTITAGSGMQVPAPQLAPEPDLTALRRELGNALKDSSYHWADGDGDAVSNLYNLSGRTLELLAQGQRDDPNGADILAQWISVHGNRRNGEFGETYLREMVTYRSAFSSSTDGAYIEVAVGSLGEYKRLPRMDDYSAAGPELKRFIQGLLAITDHLYSDWHDTDEDSVPKVIHEPELEDLIFDNPEKVELIHNVIVERKTTDVETIKAVIDSGPSALGSGAL
jgi:hypothetical protein